MRRICCLYVLCMPVLSNIWGELTMLLLLLFASPKTICGCDFVCSIRRVVDEHHTREFRCAVWLCCCDWYVCAGSRHYHDINMNIFTETWISRKPSDKYHCRRRKDNNSRCMKWMFIRPKLNRLQCHFSFGNKKSIDLDGLKVHAALCLSFLYSEE